MRLISWLRILNPKKGLTSWIRKGRKLVHPKRKRNKKKKLGILQNWSKRRSFVFFVRPVYGSLILARSGAEESDGRARIKVCKSAAKKSNMLALSMSIQVNLEDLLYVLCFSWFTIGTTSKS
ncbi:hypothetical protein ACFX2H_015359 [Malus domestica]